MSSPAGRTADLLLLIDILRFIFSIINDHNLREYIMDAKFYCDSVGIELIGWKAKLCDVIRNASESKSPKKQKIDPMIKELNTLIDDLDRKIERMAHECPTEWSVDKTQIDNKLSRMKNKWKEVWGLMSEKEDEEEYGIGGA